MTHTTPRQRYAAAAVTVAALLAVAGCTANGPSPAPSDSAATGASVPASVPLPAAEGVTQYPLTITSAVGEIVIEERPERVVMASSWDADLFAALGVVPVGTDEQVNFYPWAIEAFPGEIETLWPVGDDPYPAEVIASLAPQLVVDTSATDASSVHKVSEAAPFLGAPGTGEDTVTWQERLLLLGSVLDLSGRAQQVIDDYAAEFEGIRSQHPEFAGKTVDYLVFWGGEWGTGFINTTGSDAEALLTDLGFDTNSHAGDLQFAEDFSEELWGTLTGDVLVISDQGLEGEIETFLANPLIQGLESVQNGRVVVLHVNDDFTVTYEGELTGFSGHFGRAFSVGPLSKLEIAHLVTPLIAGVVE